MILSGIKIWGVACHTGYCFVGYSDAGFTGDPNLREWADCPLGRICRMVLFVLFHACQALATQLDGSGTYMATDSYFTSPILFACLAERYKMYAVGTLKSNIRGLSVAKDFWAHRGRSTRKKGDMCFARFGNMVFTQWMDSKQVLFLSTVHIGSADFIAQPYR